LVKIDDALIRLEPAWFNELEKYVHGITARHEKMG
jgi:hypothetical protein